MEVCMATMKERQRAAYVQGRGALEQELLAYLRTGRVVARASTPGPPARLVSRHG
jgi:hypothetical protein